MGHRDASEASHVHVADVLSSGHGTAPFVLVEVDGREDVDGTDDVDGMGDVDRAGCTCVEQMGMHVEVHVDVLVDDSLARNVAGRITTLRATGTDAPCFGDAGADDEGEGGEAGGYTFSLFDSSLVLQFESLARNNLLPISVTLQDEAALKAEAWRSPRFMACVAESTSCENSASQACGLGSEARGSGRGGDELGLAGVGLAGGDEVDAVGQPAVGRADDDGGGLAGGPMGCPTDGEAASTDIDRVAEATGDAGDEAAGDVLGMTPTGTALRRVPADRMGRDADDAGPEEVDGEAEEPGTTRLDALDVDEDPAEALARVRDTWGDTVDSCSWISIMWSPNRIVRLSGAFPERKSFTCRDEKEQLEQKGQNLTNFYNP